MTARNAAILGRIYAAESPEELEAGYDAWAEAYEADLVSFGYRLPGAVAGFFGRHVAVTAGTILDAGAGTGMVGELLHLIGYRDLVAIDLSEAMLEVARRKGIYGEARRMRLGGPLAFPDDRFAATTAVGVLTVGHARPESFDELIRVTRPGGHMIFSIRVDGEAGRDFLARQEHFEREGIWRPIERTEPFQSMPLAEPEVLHRVFVYRVA